MKVAILGASGFVGTSLVEQLTRSTEYDLRLFSHSGRSAARLASQGVSLQQLDVLDARQLRDAIAGVEVVVDLVMGDDRTLARGWQNVLNAASKARIRKLVHISSITAYGEPPPAESVSEDAIPRPAPGSYGAIKLKQDLDAARFAKKGLDITVLCPPIVTGPHSPQLLGILESLEASRLFLVEAGSLPCATVDVRNLADLIERSFHGPRADGTRIFALDDPIPTWAQLVQGLREITGPDCATPSISRSTAAELVTRAEGSPFRPVKAARHLLSTPVRSALRNDPTWSRFEKAAAKFARNRLPSRVVDRIRSQPALARGPSPDPLENADVGQLKRQLRNVWHRPEKAHRVLSYEPTVSFQQSLSDFARWVERERGSTGEFASLARYLSE